MICFFVLQFDLWTATYDMPERTLLASLFGAWIGYPIVFVGAMLYRIFLAPSNVQGEEFIPMFPEGLSVTKDVLYGVLDAWSKGVFALWTAYTVFGLTLFNAPHATPYNWTTHAAHHR